MFQLHGLNIILLQWYWYRLLSLGPDLLSTFHDLAITGLTDIISTTGSIGIVTTGEDGGKEGLNNSACAVSHYQNMYVQPLIWL